MNLMKTISFYIIILSIGFSTKLIGQGNGSLLSYQGLFDFGSHNAKSMALGESFIGRVGELQSINFNPAGMIGLDKLSFEVSATHSSNSFRKNNVWLPGSPRLNLSLYLDGLYTPTMEQNGIWASEMIKRTSPYAWNLDEFSLPDRGNDPYSEDVADFQTANDKTDFLSIQAALPMELMGRNFAFGFSYNRRLINDVDWNGTTLDPHFGAPGSLPQTDTLKPIWSIYNRERIGVLNDFSFGLAYEIDNTFRIGLKANYLNGETDDKLALDRVGIFVFENKSGLDDWNFTYDFNEQKQQGVSKFSSLAFTIGTVINLDNFSFGLTYTPSSTLEREWNYNYSIVDSTSSTSFDSSGTDKLNLPYNLGLGIVFHPHELLKFSIDYKYNPLSKSEFEKSSDTLGQSNSYVNSRTFSAGIEYQPMENLTLIAGYRNSSKPFVGESNAITDLGPIESHYSFGVGYNFFFGKIFAAYSYSQLKYYDLYLNNRNYSFYYNSKAIISYSIKL